MSKIFKENFCDCISSILITDRMFEIEWNTHKIEDEPYEKVTNGSSVMR